MSMSIISMCHRCGSTTNLIRLSKYQSRCRECNTGYVRDWRNRNKQKVYAAVLRHRNNPKYDYQRKAWGLASRIPSKPCEVCGRADSKRHHDDYSKPLEVRFLCPVHHKQIHPGFMN